LISDGAASASATTRSPEVQEGQAEWPGWQRRRRSLAPSIAGDGQAGEIAVDRHQSFRGEVIGAVEDKAPAKATQGFTKGFPAQQIGAAIIVANRFGTS